MKKIGIFAGILALGAIGAYALVPALFPNTPAFPRIPVGSGTIGEMLGRLIGMNDLANYFGDGTVENTNSLSWISASGYLQSITCPGVNSWKGIDANGKALCGPRVPMLTDYGRVSDQKCPATIYKTDGTTVMSSSGYVLKGGDIVKTPVGCDLTIAFSDFSTLHLDEDTTVSLDMGSFPDNTTIATAILEGGQIWGRILTETWVYNVGTHDIVAAVRGTSIAVSKTGGTIEIMQMTDAGVNAKWNISGRFGVGPNGTKLAVVDSTLPTTSAKIHCEMGWSLKTIANLDMKPGEVYTASTFDHECPRTTIITPTDQLYTENRWIASNTLKDLDYMSGVLQNRNLPTPKSAKITNEYNLSFPLTPLEKSTICLPGEKFFPAVFGIQNILGMKLELNPCNTIWITEYTQNSWSNPFPLSDWTFVDYSKSGPPTAGELNPLAWDKWYIFSANTYDRIYFSSSTEKIKFLSKIRGKKLVIIVSGLNAFTSGTSRYLLDLGNMQYYYWAWTSINWQCFVNGRLPSPSLPCSSSTDLSDETLPSGDHKITIYVSWSTSLVTDFVLWNKAAWSKQLKAKIKALYIKN